MKSFAVLSVLFIFSSQLLSAEGVEPYPANNGLYFSKDGVNKAYYDKLISLEGQILRIERGQGDKPIYQIGLPIPILKKVWVASLLVLEGNKIKINERIRVLGYLQKVKGDDEYTKSLTSDEFHVLGFCFLNINTLQAYYLTPGITQCRGWEAGKNAGELM